MILVEVWLVASLLLGACWALAGWILGEATEWPYGADPVAGVFEVQPDGEAA